MSNPERDWGRPSWPSNPPRDDVLDDNEGCWLTVVAVAMAAMVVVLAVSLLVLRVDLRHDAPGGPPPAFVVVGTPTTYGPPPAR